MTNEADLYRMIKKYRLRIWRDYADDDDHEIKWHVGIPASEADPALMRENTLGVSESLDDAILQSVAKIDRLP